jgi:hypothetical protein
MKIKTKLAFRVLLGQLIVAAAFGSSISTAQVYTAQGYTSTPNPISPACTPPELWTLTNGYYSCQLPPPPTCADGDTETAAPTWNGSSWVGLGCATPPPSLPPGGTPTSERAACVAAWDASSKWLNSLGPNVPVTGPLTGNGMDQYNTFITNLENVGDYNIGSMLNMGSTPSASTQNDMFYINTLPDAICWVDAGTNNVIGLYSVSFCTANQATVNCGGGGIGN